MRERKPLQMSSMIVALAIFLTIAVVVGVVIQETAGVPWWLGAAPVAALGIAAFIFSLKQSRPE